MPTMYIAQGINKKNLIPECLLADRVDNQSESGIPSLWQEYVYKDGVNKPLDNKFKDSLEDGDFVICYGGSKERYLIDLELSKIIHNRKRVFFFILSDSMDQLQAYRNNCDKRRFNLMGKHVFFSTTERMAKSLADVFRYYQEYIAKVINGEDLEQEISDLILAEPCASIASTVCSSVDSSPKSMFSSRLSLNSANDSDDETIQVLFNTSKITSDRNQHRRRLTADGKLLKCDITNKYHTHTFFKPVRDAKVGNTTKLFVKSTDDLVEVTNLDTSKIQCCSIM